MSKISFRSKSVVAIHGRQHRIVRAVSATEVLVEDIATKSKEVVHVSNLDAPGKKEERPKARLLEAIADDDLQEARRRLEIIRPLLPLRRGRKERAREVAKDKGIGEATVWRWLALYEASNLLSDLAPRRKGRKMPNRLDSKVEAIVDRVIEEIWLTKQQVTTTHAYKQLQQFCRAAKLKAPDISTFRRRLRLLPEELKVRRRRGRKEARDKFGPVHGHFPGADYPLAVVQIDHTPVDIILVDDDDGLPIGRPRLTLAIDVYSRMVTGFYLSLDPPSALSVGICIAHSALRKEGELTSLGIKGEWPVWGICRNIHTDNGREFHSLALEQGCAQYGIDLTWRPVKQPHFGGHIERLLGTFATEIRALPGATFSNPKQRGEYASEKKACMTYDALYRWLVQFIVGVYHNRKHDSLGCPPIEQWRRGVVGHGQQKGTGLPDPVDDPIRFQRDFLPAKGRAVLSDGITWDNVTYFHDVLRPWINAKKGGVAAKFTVRRDPRDISRIYFYDPELQEYLTIPYRDIAKPSISLWSLREAKRRLKAQGLQAVDEDQIFEAHAEMSKIVEQSKADTKKVRRARQRAKLHNRPSVPGLPVPPSPPGAAPSHLSLIVDNTGGDEFDVSLDDIDVTLEDIR